MPAGLKTFLATFLFLLMLIASFGFGNTYAKDAFPPPGLIPCDDEKGKEFSSDRPYQASPCGDNTPISYFCGNKVVVNLGTVSTRYCDPLLGQKKECPVNIHKKQDILISLKDVQLPILGNTQLTVNSQNPDDQIDDSTKINNFVSWYLNGTNDKAEYPDVDPNTPDGIKKIIDTSGPIKKLMPSAIQDAQRLSSIVSASKEEPPFIPDGTNFYSNDPQNHNQIVVCANGSNPDECYKGGGDKYRLKDWSEGRLSLFNSFFNMLGAQKWNNKYPPLPWQFTENLYYKKAYNEWRGATCLIVPVFNTLFCADIPFISPTRKWADLYPYVPLANTVDKEGEQKIKQVNINAPKAKIENEENKIITSPTLYLSHSLENYSLTNFLKSSYVPTKVEVGNTKGYPGQTTGSAVEDNSTTCKVLDSRTNPGDDATFSKPKSWISVVVEYDVTSIECTDPKYECTPFGCGYQATCRSPIVAELPSVSETPYADEIWKNTVSGSDAIFRKIYPKVGPNAPVTCIADTPAASTANYNLADASSPDVSLASVVLPDGKTTITSPDGKKVVAQLYYPHYGGVLDYFLKGIQTALRPQGFADPTPVSGQSCTDIKCGELPKLPKAAGSCKLSNISSRVGNIPQSLMDIVEAAAETYKTPPNLILAEMYGEGLFNPGRYEWNDQNVKNWATCVKIPGCSEIGPDNFMGFHSDDWPTVAKGIEDDIKALDPTRSAPNQCNLLDAIYGAAWNLHSSADGSHTFAGKSCLKIPLNWGLESQVPNSCDWSPSQYESAIRIYEFGTGWGSTQWGFFTCATKDDSCLKGGGADAQCLSDTATNFDTCATSGNNSHNLCVWEVAHGQ